MANNSLSIAISGLDELDESVLFRELGKRLQSIKSQPELSGHFDLTVPSNIETEGLGDDFRDFGRRFFFRVSEQAYMLVCGTEPEDSKERQTLSESLTLGKESFAAALATVLVAQLGLAPAVAAVVSVIIVRMFFKPALGAMCDLWKIKNTELRKS